MKNGIFLAILLLASTSCAIWNDSGSSETEFEPPTFEYEIRTPRIASSDPECICEDGTIHADCSVLISIQFDANTDEAAAYLESKQIEVTIGDSPSQTVSVLNQTIEIPWTSYEATREERLTALREKVSVSFDLPNGQSFLTYVFASFPATEGPSLDCVWLRNDEGIYFEPYLELTDFETRSRERPHTFGARFYSEVGTRYTMFLDVLEFDGPFASNPDDQISFSFIPGALGKSVYKFPVEPYGSMPNASCEFYFHFYVVDITEAVASQIGSADELYAQFSTGIVDDDYVFWKGPCLDD